MGARCDRRCTKPKQAQGIVPTENRQIEKHNNATQPIPSTPLQHGSALTALWRVRDQAIQGHMDLTTSKPTNKKTVFLVTADAVETERIFLQIQYFGYEVVTLTTLKAFARMLGKHVPDAIIIDIQMPDGKGTKAIDVILNKHKLTNIPVLFLSSMDSMNTRLAVVRTGGVAFYKKPVNVAHIIDRLDSLLLTHEDERHRVLVVDDSKSLSMLLAQILNNVGIETKISNDPMDVLKKMEAFHPDLILMDVHMPECTGLELASVIRQQQAYVGIPIVYLSGEANMNKKLAAMSLGGDDFLTKPIQPDHLVSSVVSRLKRARTLRAFMVRDGLTGLLNHTTSKERLNKEVIRAKRQGTKLSFAMIDIDHFKHVNDTYGHPTGDGVIRSLARLLKQRVRTADIVGRFGGEEFAAILPETDGPTGQKMLDEIRKMFGEIGHHGGEEVFKKTFSCGVAEFPAFGSAIDLNNAADKALYEAKNGGRNQTVLAQNSTQPGGTLEWQKFYPP